MLLALKAWALTERNKAKDGCDVVWMLKALGTQTIATRFREAGIGETPFGIEALNKLELCFSTYQHTGPQGWSHESLFEGAESACEARDAAGLVQEFVRLARD